MSSSSAGNQVGLNIRTADDAAEIFVIDGQFRMVQRGVGHLETVLEPGLYKVKVRAGYETQERHVILPPGATEPVVEDFPALKFASPVPLGETATTHEFQTAAADAESAKIHVHAGQGSWIFVFARDWTDPGQIARRAVVPLHPARGLGLRDMQDGSIADFAQQSVSHLVGDAWAACNVEVNPGIYQLVLEAPPDLRLRQTVVAARGWQTQIFLMQRDYATKADDRYADLPGASILLSQERTPGSASPCFTSNSPSLRLVELARCGLTNGRQVLSRQVIHEILHGKFENPMLGLLGAHLLLLQGPPDLAALAIVVSNLRRLLGTHTHPDIEALNLLLEPDEGSCIFDVPPILRRSWALVLDATVRRPGLVPPGSLAARVADRLWGEEPWLLWMPPAAARPHEPVAYGLEALQQPETDCFEEALQTYLQPARQQGRTGLEGVSFSRGAADALPALQVDDREIARLVHALGVPRANVETLLARSGVVVRPRAEESRSAAAVSTPAEGTNSVGSPEVRSALEQASKAAHMANEDKWCFAWFGGRTDATGANRAALVKGAKWTSGDKISVSFLDGEPSVQQKVRDVALQWTAPGLANLRLVFQNDTNSLLRISFRYPGSWSVIGTTCKQIADRTQPTMNFGWLNPSTADEEVRRVVLHEFGHALGLIHEHQNPEGGIHWNRENVIRDLSGPPNNWPLDVIEHNMFEPYATEETNATQTDPQSIMMYPIPASWTMDGFSVGLNGALSAKDQQFIHQQYP